MLPAPFGYWEAEWLSRMPGVCDKKQSCTLLQKQTKQTNKQNETGCALIFNSNALLLCHLKNIFTQLLNKSSFRAQTKLHVVVNAQLSISLVRIMYVYF